MKPTPSSVKVPGSGTDWLLPPLKRRLPKSLRPLEGKTVIVKKTNSAFIGTNLEAQLRAARQTILIVAGVITNNSVEATIRMAGNLGFETYLV